MAARFSALLVPLLSVQTTVYLCSQEICFYSTDYYCQAWILEIMLTETEDEENLALRDPFRDASSPNFQK